MPPPGSSLDGLDGDPTTFDGPELARNHTLHTPWEYEAGGMKWEVGQVTIRNADVHENDYQGAVGRHQRPRHAHRAQPDRGRKSRRRSSTRSAERGHPQQPDLRQRTTVRHQAGTGTAASRWPPAPTSRSTATAYPATATESPGPGRRHRPDFRARQAHLLDHFHVHNNLICTTAGGDHPTGVAADDSPSLATRDINFTDNTIQAAPCR